VDNAIFVQNIKVRCKILGKPPTAACKDAGVGASFISDLNRGQTPSVAKVQMLADYLGCTTSELLGESPAPAGDSAPASDQQLKAAFWGGDKDLSQEDLDAMWADVKNFAAFVAEKKKREKQQDG